MNSTMIDSETSTACEIDRDRRIIRLDNTAINLWRMCPAKFGYRISDGLVRHGEEASSNLHLHYGIAWHAAMDALYRAVAETVDNLSIIKCSDGTVDKNVDISYVDENIVEEWGTRAKDAWETATIDLAEDEKNKKTVGRGLQDIDAYIDKHYDDLQTYELVDCEVMAKGQIEFIYDGDMWTLEYVGALDKVLKSEEGLRVRDHKTMGYVNMHTGTGFLLANQLMGYAFLMSEMYGQQEVVTETDIVAITRTKPPSDFMRTHLVMTPDKINEWVKEITATCISILTCDTLGTWPRYGHEPCTRYGTCEYMEICLADADIRPDVAKKLYTVSPWDPGNRDSGNGSV